MRTYVLDASALLAYFLKKPGAIKVGDLFKEASHARAAILISAVSFGEVYGFILREHGIDRARNVFSAIHPLPITFAEATVQRCCFAAETKERYKLYYADGFVAALAIENKATIVTSDSDFRRLGHNVPILWLKL